MTTPWEEGVADYERGVPIWRNPYAPSGETLPWEEMKAHAWTMGWEAAELQAIKARRRGCLIVIGMVVGFVVIVILSALAFRR